MSTKYKTMKWRASFDMLTIEGTIDDMTERSDQEFEDVSLELLKKVFRPEVKIEFQKLVPWEAR